MKKLRAVLIFFGAVLLVFSINPENALSEVDVHIGIGVQLPALVLSAPPAVVVVPGTYVYYAPDVEAELVFYHGYWYRPYSGVWYRATYYNGPWVHIAIGSVPGVLRSLPPDYRRVPPGHQRIPYGQLKKNWKAWENQKHWDKPAVKGQQGGKPEKMEQKGHGKGKEKGKRGD